MLTTRASRVVGMHATHTPLARYRQTQHKKISGNDHTLVDACCFARCKKNSTMMTYYRYRSTNSDHTVILRCSMLPKQVWIIYFQHEKDVLHRMPVGGI